MKKYLCYYPVPFFVKGDVVYDSKLHLLLTVTHVMHNPTLPIFKVIDTVLGYPRNYNVGDELPLDYSASTKSLSYVCKNSSLSRFRNRYKNSSLNIGTRLDVFLWNFKALRTCEE